jgi:hypothetical protein
MGLGSLLLSLERRYAWGLLAFITGTVTGVGGLYLAVRQKKPELAYQIASESNVLDVHASLPELSVLYRGEDIQQANLNLRILRLRVANTGTADILQAQYDQQDTFGLRVEGARVLEVRQVDASVPYLSNAVRPQLVDQDIVRFEKPILESGAWFTVEILILHEKTREPRLTAIGKVAGVPEPAVAGPEPALERRSIWRDITSPSIGVQLVRLLVYPVAVILLFVAVIGTGSFVGSTLNKRGVRHREHQMRSLLQTSSPDEVVAKEILVSLYGQNGTEGLVRARKVVSDPGHLKRAVGEWRQARRLQRSSSRAIRMAQAPPPHT